MIKRIIFDLDNTLISNVDFNKPVIETFEELDYYYSEKELMLIQYCIGKYEQVMSRYDKKEMLKFFKKYSNLNLDMNFFETYFSKLEHLVPDIMDPDIIETLEHLYDRYELCVLTNWFKESQSKRLENAGILKYFEDVYGGELVKKPDKASYISACNGVPARQTLMVGDSLVFDYQGARKAGLRAILLDKKEEHLELSPKSRIKEIKQLKKVL